MLKFFACPSVAPNSQNTIWAFRNRVCVFQTVKVKFKVAGGRDMLATLSRIYDFRNTRVAHQETDITDPKEALQNLVGWINGLRVLAEAP
jgi:hypothetical protein